MFRDEQHVMPDVSHKGTDINQIIEDEDFEDGEDNFPTNK